jgi:cytochrome c oxidase subunit I
MTAVLPETTGRDAATELSEIWEDRPGLSGFFTTVDHKRIATRYFVTAFTFLLLGGIEAILIRTQLARPDNDVLGAERYNQLMTMHGTTMILLFNTPMFAAFGNYLIPLQIGARDMAFPRLNALSYWIFLMSGGFMYASFLVGSIPDGGWFAYTPLTENEFSTGHGLDFWAIGITFLGISTTVGGINFIVTILRMRTPGMSLNRMPLFTWGILTMSAMIVFALPAVTLSGALLELDRAAGMHFFDATAGGDPLLYQHLFWIWGHPEVYIVFIPATGIISMVVAAMTRRPIVGYSLVVAALVATGFISFGLWVHHMFATGVPFLVASFFSAASLLVAIPSGMQIFAWLATIYDGGVRLETPMLFAIGFVVTFVLGGFTGVMVAVVPWDQAVTDSYFVVAHFHYVLIGGSVMPILAGIYFWFPKVTGYLMTRWLGKLAFVLIFVGFHLTFFVQHILGMLGMPRRVYTYHEGLGWDGMNLLSTIGAYVLAAGFLVVTVDLVVSYRRKVPSPPNPWGAESLEWSVPSPPPVYNFAEFPVVQSASPLWDASEGASLVTISEVDGESLTQPTGHHHRTLVTSVLDASSLEVVSMPTPAWWPVLLSTGLLGLSTATLLRSWIIGAIAGVVTVYAFYRWHRDGHA